MTKSFFLILIFIVLLSIFVNSQEMIFCCVCKEDNNGEILTNAVYAKDGCMAFCENLDDTQEYLTHYEGDCVDEIRRIHRGGARLREDWSEGEDPRGSDIYEACRLRRGRVGYTRVCECKCSCMCKCRCRCRLLHGNAEDLLIDQALDGIP